MEGKPGAGLSQGGRFCLKIRKNILALEQHLKMQGSKKKQKKKCKDLPCGKSCKRVFALPPPALGQAALGAEQAAPSTQRRSPLCGGFRGVLGPQHSSHAGVSAE